MVTNLGWIHPEGPSYPASLFTSDGTTRIASLARRPRQPWEWISCDVGSTPPSCRAAEIATPDVDSGVLNRALLYGSATRDASGGHYVVGIGRDYRPVILRVLPNVR